MNAVINWIRGLPLGLLVIGSLTLGLAPFVPQPHLVEKIGFLLNGTLSRPIDIFDLFMHGAFPTLLLARLILGGAPGDSDKA